MLRSCAACRLFVLIVFQDLPTCYVNHNFVCTAADTFNDNETPFAYQLIAENHTPPVLSFDGEWASEAKVGERYILPGISVQATGDYTLFISVTTPSGLNTVLLDTETDLIFNSAGKYKIALMVIDENGNTSSHIVDVTVV